MFLVRFDISQISKLICGIHCTKFEPFLKPIPTRNESPRHRLAEPRQPRKKNTPCISDLAGVKFLLKKERVFFFRGSALQVFGQCGGTKCGLGFAKTIFWGKDLAKHSANLF
jgi:hypothetical protein